MWSEQIEVHFKGSPICQGIAIGPLVIIDSSQEEISKFQLSEQDVEQEVVRYQQAVKRSCQDVKKLQQKLSESAVYEGASILDSHLQIMQDPVLASKIELNIRENLWNAEYVLDHVIRETETEFKALSDPFFQERGSDVQDISKRVMGHLRQSASGALKKLPVNSIVIIEELTPSEVAEADLEKISAFITHRGGTGSHSAIMARAKGIPFISNLDYSIFKPYQGCVAIVDGTTGDFIINPNEETIHTYQKKKKAFEIQARSIADLGKLRAETYDGYQIKLSANIDMDHDIDLIHEYGGHGVGLFRSESIFLKQQKIPSEEEQYQIYRKLLVEMKGLPVVIRTFDIGGDKQLNIKSAHTENSSFLSLRAMRLMLQEKEVFKTQLKAILRASVWGNVSIMFPMISSLAELIEAKKILKEAEKELRSLGHKEIAPLPVGCMIEVPSAAITADLLARECDFLSIGTNDLIQYTLAVDRGDHHLRKYYTPLHPGILRLIKLIVTEANQVGIPVSVCGEAAADPQFIPLLMGLGVHGLSVASRFIPRVKQTIRALSIIEASELADKALRLSSGREILELVQARE